MSRRGRSHHRAESPHARDDAAPLTPDEPDDAQEMDEDEDEGPEPADDGDDQDGAAGPEPEPRRPRGRSMWKRETRFGIAALLSFVILVSVLVMNKGNKKATPLQIASSAAKDDPAAKGDSAAPPAKAEPGSGPGTDMPPLPAGTPESPGPAPEGVQPASNEQAVPPPSNEPGNVPPLPGANTPSSEPAPPEGAPTAGGPELPAPVLPPTGQQDPPTPTPAGPANEPEPPPSFPKELEPQAPPLPQAPETPAPAEPLLPPTSDAPPPPARPAAPEREVKPAPEPPPARTTTVPTFTAPPRSDSPDDPSGPPRFDLGAGIPIPNAGKGQSLDDDRAAGAAAVAAGAAAGAAARAAREDKVESLRHVVGRGENFWTISRKYYGSGRYYKALWKANSRVVAAPDKLYVGTRIIVPPPEALDRTLVEPPRVTKSSPAAGAVTPRGGSAHSPAREAAATATATTARSSDNELTLPVADAFTDRGPARDVPDPGDDEAEVRYRPATPRYRVGRNETLRSIASRTLGSGRRAREILELNRELIDDPNHLVEGQVLKLPEDAQLGLRPR